MIARIALVYVGLLWPLAAPAQDAQSFEQRTPNTIGAPAGTKSPRATLADFAWFEGQWTGTGMGGTTDESWSRAGGGAMMGMFRLLKGDAVVFYEFLTLVEQEGTVVLKLKHFNADLTGWEEKADFVTFRLLKVTPTEVNFSGLTFRRVGDNRLEIFLALRSGKEGPLREESFRLERARSVQ